MVRWGRSRALAAVLVIGAVGLVACGDGDVGAARQFDVEFREPERGEVLISLPSSVGAGLVSFRLKNSGTVRHDAQLIRVTGDQDRDDVASFFRSASRPGFRIPSWVRGGGGAIGIRPGETVVVKQRLDEGDWYLVDLAFLDRGGVAPFIATSGGSAADLPSATSRIRARDFSFEPRALRPGTHRVRFENRGREMHEVVLLPLVPGRTVDDAKAYLSDPNPSVPLSQAPVYTTDPVRLPLLDRGEALVGDVTLGRGTYILACRLPDRAGGTPHAAKGMVAEVQVG